MIVKLLGTGAADGIPAMFGDCRLSRIAREQGGKDYRTRCGALIDGHLKLDLPPDTFSQMQREGLCANDWSALIFTHADADHFAVKELQYALHPFTQNLMAPFAIFANQHIIDEIDFHYPHWPFEVHFTKSFVPFRHGEYEITPIAANHSRGEDCHNLIVSDGSATFLYATDTGLWEPPTWEFLEGCRLDGLVIECTNGRINSDYWGHLSLETCVWTVNQLRERGILRPDAKVVTTHHSAKGDMSHAELEDALRPHGIVPGYDGIEFEVCVNAGGG